MASMMEIEVLEDGTISIKTGEIGAKEHMSADELLKRITELAGGSVNTEHLRPKWTNKAVVKKTVRA